MPNPRPTTPSGSRTAPGRADVWSWPTGATSPVLAGTLEEVGEQLAFTYTADYLSRPDAVALDEADLPLTDRRQHPTDTLTVVGCLNDAGPDGWGQQLLAHTATSGRWPTPLERLTGGGEDRIGAFDIRPAGSGPPVTVDPYPLDEIVAAVSRYQAGEPYDPARDQVLAAGIGVGGARPKGITAVDGTPVIAKFEAPDDTYPTIQAEMAAMRLARLAGLDVAAVSLVTVAGQHVLLVERFDRPTDGTRRQLLSALSLCGLDEIAARHATYPHLADQLSARSDDPQTARTELFARIVFNILVGNTDDHARNHAVFNDAGKLTLTPAYDICPQPRTGGEATQAMAIGTDGFRLSQLAGVEGCAELYGLTIPEARLIIDGQLETIHTHWRNVADEARLTDAQRSGLWGRQILNPFATEHY